MRDDEFLAALESCALKEQDFGHAAHVRAAYLYSCAAGFEGALDKIRRALVPMSLLSAKLTVTTRRSPWHK
jgi:hypothetical protein